MKEIVSDKTHLTTPRFWHYLCMVEFLCVMLQLFGDTLCQRTQTHAESHATNFIDQFINQMLAQTA
jgi:hypothetical protein